MAIDMPASIENDAEVVAAEFDVCTVYYVTTIFDRDAGEIAAFGDVARMMWQESERKLQMGRVIARARWSIEMNLDAPVVEAEVEPSSSSMLHHIGLRRVLLLSMKQL
jgi:hypothetical protein